MASLLKIWVTEYHTPDGKKCSSSTPGAIKRRVKSSKWYGQGIPGLPRGKRVPLHRDRKAAQRMLDDLVRQGERGAAHLPDANEAATSIESLLGEFRQYLERKAKPQHVTFVLRNCRLLLDAARVRVLADLRARDIAARIESAIWQRKKDTSGSTAKQSGKQLRSFTRWLWRKRRVLDHDPLAAIELPGLSKKRNRRAMTPDEFRDLIETTEQSQKVWRRLTGPDRATLYLVAVATGYRRGELAAITRADVRYAEDPPVIVLRDELTKSGRDARQIIPRSLATRLADRCRKLKAADRVFPGCWVERSSEMLAADLVASGVEVKTAEGQLDFHALRTTYTTWLSRLASPKVTQDLARHASITTTMEHYVRVGEAERVEAVERLPLPGGAVDVFASMSREQLEAVARVAVAFLGSILRDGMSEDATAKRCLPTD